MARKSKASINQEIIATALRQFDKSVSSDDANRTLCREERDFAAVAGAQWDTRWGTDPSKPRFEVNRISHAINQVVGEYSRNQITTKIRPKSGDASVDTANTLNGIIRNIYNQSHFQFIQFQAFKEVAYTGFGAWRVLNEYEDDKGFDQCIKIEAITDALNTVWFDGTDKDPLKRNSRFAFVTSDIDKDEFREMYPDSAMNSFERLNNGNSLMAQGWANTDTIRVAEYYKKTEKTKTIVKMDDGSVYDYEDIKPVLDEMEQARAQAQQAKMAPADGMPPQEMPEIPNIVEKRKIKYDEVTWQKITGSEVLEGPVVLDSKYIPIVPVYGYNQWVDTNHIFYGMVRPAKDSQRLYNYAVSAAVEAAANSPLDPIFITPSQVAGYEDQYKNANVRNTPFLFYNPEDGEQLPFRIGAPVVQQALIEQANRAERDIQATLGRNESALGEITATGGGVASGAALKGAQKQSNLGQEELFRNMGNAVEYTGEILVDLIPKVYTHETQMRLLNQDGTTDFVPVNEQMVDIQTGETVIMNDLGLGKYDTEVTLSPSFETQRQETLAMLTTLGAENPAFIQSTADILAKSMDFPEAEEISKRMRKQMINAGLVMPNEEEQKVLDQEAQAKAQQGPTVEESITLESMKLDLETKAANVDFLASQILESQANVQKTLANADKAEIESITKIMDAMTKSFEAGMRDQKEMMALLNQQIVETQNSLADTLPAQINAAFASLQPGMYETENGEIFAVDEQGQIQPPNIPGQLPGEQ